MRRGDLPVRILKHVRHRALKNTDTATAALGPAVKPGGVFALQIGNQRYPLEKTARDLVDDCGFGVVATRFTEMSDHGYVGLGTDGAVERDPAEHEVVLLLRAGGHGVEAPVDVAEKYGHVL